MPDDVGGRPFPDGDEPDSHSRGAADEEFASVVFDEAFVRSARIHEPTAAERSLQAAQARAEADAVGALSAPGPAEDEYPEELLPPDIHGYGDPGYAADGPYGPYGGALRPYRERIRWHRPVAWLLAVVMGIGMVALAFTAVYRGATNSRQTPSPPPATTEVDRSRPGSPAGRPGAVPSLPSVPAPQTVSAIPRER
ncbi:SCO2584 family spore wall biosynthesis protein [Streptomyces meridianus]|uniref:Uncharacterized protein n=1 Tax=Streptomyces meridianus TaxID=2938945 RepID=A0ABT0X284_9ACTN|nr:hypothetical protein [Streptomyces meridianus]MCM2576033.1 hypothetical protein [Streptomyces meridianus]